MATLLLVHRALEATIDDALAADGYLLGTTANFGYMSGALKHFFDTTFWEQVAPELAVVGEVNDGHRELALELGATIAAHLMD